MEAKAFSPAHITGFFVPHYDPQDPARSGSRGAGYSITKGVTTHVHAEPSPKDSVEIRVNGSPETRAPVSHEVIRLFLAGTTEKFAIEVEHRVEVPIGAGFGASAAAALSLALAFNHALGNSLSTEEAARIAHTAEVICGTGLGGVSAEYVGGLEARTKPGAPGVGDIRRIDECERYISAALSLGAIPTEQVLRSNPLRRRLAESGDTLVDRFIREPSPDAFLRFSRRFADESGLLTTRLRRVLAETDRTMFTCSMAMIGETAFTLVPREEAQDVVKMFRDHVPEKGQILVTDVDAKGARLL